ncbi:hypothetical protein JCM3774_004780 [Rhodotorula dairenensis]
MASTAGTVLPVPSFVAAAVVAPPSPSSSSATTATTAAGRTPRRKIFTEADLAPWFKSSAYADLERTVFRLTAAVQGQSNAVACTESEPTKKLVSFLRDAKLWVAETRLAPGPQRFGNKAFRDWMARLEEAESGFQRELLATVEVPPDLTGAALPELSFHLLSSFGSPQRLDYGTGHELSFLCYLVCLCRLRVFSETDEHALVVRVFAEYIEVCRQVQKVFKLEPAGSKGVWGLDDHQHLVYLFGASQLIGHPSLRPASILSTTDVAAEAPSYLFLSSIAHIRELKRGPFHEHSPLLHQIATTVPTWHKVTKGLWDMYKVEVLSKVPVVQHCRFGDVGMRWIDSVTGEALPSSGDGRADDEDEGANAAAQLDTFVVTPAPWTHGGGGNAPASAMGEVRPLPPPKRFGGSTTVSTQYASSSAAHARRQHPTTLPLAPPIPVAVGVTSPFGSNRPVSFAPPTLFPPRGGAGPTTQIRTSATSARSTTTTGPSGGSPEPTADGTGTLAAQGGAAASTSPFGVLPPARLGSSGPAAWNAEEED